MKVAWDTIYCHPLPASHRFPMEKYQLLPQQLIHHGIVSSHDFFRPGYLAEAHIVAVHKDSYWNKLKNLALNPAEVRKTGFPLSQQLVERETIIAQGTIEVALFALEYGIAFNIAGGTHHAGKDFGEGFCLLNDLAIASRYLIDRGLAKKVLIIDLDVHQGNGTAEIFREDPRVVTFSMHGARNFPLKKQKSDLDCPLDDNSSDETYLSKLQEHLEEFCHRVKADFIFFQAGVDVLKSDILGRLSLSMEGCKQRDRLVLEFCKQRSIPVAVVMGGGYSPNVSTIIEAHTNTYQLGRQMYF